MGEDVNAIKIVREWLEERGYDGLAFVMGRELLCSCTLDKLAPCGSISPDSCFAAHEVPGELYLLPDFLLNKERVQ